MSLCSQSLKVVMVGFYSDLETEQVDSLKFLPP